MQVLKERELKWSVSETAAGWAASRWIEDKKEPADGQRVWSVSLTGLVTDYPYDKKTHRQAWLWGNVFSSYAEAMLKSHRIGLYLQSELDLELQLSLAYSEVMRMSSLDKLTNKDWLKLMSLTSLQDQ